ncbi:MAG: ATP-binding protein [Bacteroidales bacterium]|nr:ATP-binding protein [Bacteroidales bacterium]MCF8390984.1 ATP-binding protein [Bacteroidales bacterium]
MFRPRLLYEPIKQHLSKKEYTIITGARQTGKTTILREIYREQKERNIPVYYISFENIEVLREVNMNPENLFRFVKRPINPLDNKLNEGERIILFIDEIQYLSDPSRFLKYLYDTYLENLKIVATGSSAFYMDQKFKDSLAGRKKIFQLNSLSLSEYLGFHERTDLILELENMRNDLQYLSLKKDEIADYFNEYLVFGGYPAVCLEKDRQWKEELLLEIRNAYVKKDILEAGVRNEMDFYRLMAVLASQIGNLMNRNELSKTLNLHLSTIDNYLFILQKSFHIHLIKPFYKNLRKELTKMPKVYFDDIGIRNALLNRFTDLQNREDKGALLENYAFIRLKEMYKPDTINYWRTADGNEVDFVQSDDFKQGNAWEIKFKTEKASLTKYRKFWENYPEINFELFSYSDFENGKSIIRL